MSGCWHVPPAGDKFFIGYFNEYGEKIMIDRNGVDYSYLETMGIKLKSGRDFNMNIDKPGSKIIVNQEYLDVKNIANPYDTLIKIDDRYAAKQIIGVIDDYHMRGMHEKITPQLIELDPNESRSLIVKISPNNVATTLKQIEDQYSQIFPNKAYSMGFVDDEIQNLYDDQKNYNKLISYYTIISLIIACMGLFGFVISEMNKRIKEIGIRKVNGAKVIELFNFLNKEFIMLCIAGFMISSPLALYFSKEWTKNFAYKIAPAWWILAIVLLTIILIVFVTVSIQTVRVARKNPVEALRYE
jgi:putative ABC transport system permease protein